MLIAVYGGTFNPPHIGHLSAARAASEQLKPDKLLIMPSNIPPHKTLDTDSPTSMERLSLTEKAFAEIEGAEVSDIEIKREGSSYTADTVAMLKEQYPDAGICLLMGTDMLLSFGQWYRYGWLLENVTLAVFLRRGGESDALLEEANRLRAEYGAKIIQIEQDPIDISSTQVRQSLKNRQGREFLTDSVYGAIIRKRGYGASPDFEWLRRKAYEMLESERIAHVQGTEQEALKLARRWGVDEGDAAESAILHDITKKLSADEQLLLCEKYAIITRDTENPKLLHALTGAALALDVFGVNNAVYGAIRWHTTGHPGMTTLEKIIYLADYIEPNREEFDGLSQLRTLAYEDLDAAVMLGLELTLGELQSRGAGFDPISLETLESLKNGK